MRINLDSSFLAPDPGGQVKSGARAEETARASVANNAEKPPSENLSATALASAVHQVPEVRQEKVTALAEKLRSGTYAVSARQTAEAIVTQMRQQQAA